MIVKRIIFQLKPHVLSKYKFSKAIWLSIGINLMICRNLLAGFGDFPVGARSLAMGGTYVALANTADALFVNPGGLSQIIGTEISLFYQKPFGLDDVNIGSASVSFPFWMTRLNLGFLTLGNPLYEEQDFILAYSNAFQGKIYYGASLRYHSVKVHNYGSDGTLGLDIGLILEFTRQFSLGVAAKNINRAGIGKSKEKLPQTFNTGLTLNPHPKIILSLELFKDVRFAQETRLGVEFRAFENLALRTGTANNPSRFSAGFGLHVNRFTIDYAFFTHNDLGSTHQMSFSIHLGGEKATEKKANEPLIVEVEKTLKSKPVAPQPDSVTAMQAININTASHEKLKKLPGIGEKLASAIIKYRQGHGAFLEIRDLLNVPGIGIRTFEKVKYHISVKDIANK